MTAKPHPTHQADASAGSFASGMFLGVLAGAVGMFFFQTDKGKELLNNLQKELEPWLREQAGEAGKRITEVVHELPSQVESGRKNAAQFPKFGSHRSKS